MADKVITLSKNPSTIDQQINLVKGDNKTYTVQFRIQRTYDSVDMSTLNWGVNVKNAALEETFISLSVASFDSNYVYINWTIGIEATAEAGLSFYTVEGRNDISATNPIWRSSAMSINVSNAVVVPADIDPDTADTISELASELSSAIAGVNTATANVTKIATDAVTQIENTAVRYDKAQSLTNAQKNTAQKNIGLYTLLLHVSEIDNTSQVVVFNGDVVSKIEHRANNGGTVIRTDTFNITASQIVETRRLSTGETLTLTTNLNTLNTNVVLAG